MRQGYNNTNFIESPEGGIIGLSLGYDFTAEHEWGIRNIYSRFDVKTESTKRHNGFAARKINTKANIQFHETKDGYYIASQHSRFSSPIDWSRYTIWKDTSNVAGWWDGDSFLVVHNDKELQQRLKTAFDKLDICISLSSPSPMGGNGLCLTIYSEIPEDIKKEASEGDLSRLRLNVAVKKMGIIPKLQAAGCGYYALSPRWNDTETEIKFWLNPRDQQVNNSGWYTEQQLLDWIKGKGPIPNKKRK